MNDAEIIEKCLKQLNPALLTYNEWTLVGMVVKNCGGSDELWQAWSSNDNRFKPNECKRKFKTFSTTGTVTVGSLIKLCRDYGGEINSSETQYGTGEAIGWDSEISLDDCQVIKSSWTPSATLPDTQKDWNGCRDLLAYLKALFSEEEIVGYVSEAYKPDGEDKYLPGKGIYNRTASELMTACKKYNEIEWVIGDTIPEVGAWIRFNPLDGKGVSDSNITAFRHALVESDEITVEQQYALYKELELPIAAIVHSGGKSLHAIVKIDASDRKEYIQRVEFLYEVCKKNGLKIDRQNKNPSRLSRLPGVMRGNVQQRLVETNCGKSSWAEWKEWIEAQNDDLPDVESLDTFIMSPPPLADSLIDCILRKGHKMLVSGPSKAGKSFLLLELCVAIAEGGKWLSWQCSKGRVLYINLELDRASCYHRLKDVFDALKLPYTNAGNIDLWHLRGQAMGMDKLAPRLIRRALKRRYSAIVIDPIYKVITGDENAADQMAKFCNQFDKVCAELGAAVIYCHHHSKGDQGQKRAQDRSSGSGVFARDPDALIDIIELQINDDLRSTIINRWTCDSLSLVLNKSCPDWRHEIGQDDAIVADLLTPFAIQKIGLDKTRKITEKINEKGTNTTGWRVSGILREFVGFKPIHAFFSYPVHPVDNAGLLKDCLAEGEDMNRFKMKTLQKKEETKEKSTTKMLDAFHILRSDGKKVSVTQMADYLNISTRTVYANLRRNGLTTFQGWLTLRDKLNTKGK